MLRRGQWKPLHRGSVALRLVLSHLGVRRSRNHLGSLWTQQRYQASAASSAVSRLENLVVARGAIVQRVISFAAVDAQSHDLLTTRCRAIEAWSKAGGECPQRFELLKKSIVSIQQVSSNTGSAMTIGVGVIIPEHKCLYIVEPVEERRRGSPATEDDEWWMTEEGFKTFWSKRIEGALLDRERHLDVPNTKTNVFRWLNGAVDWTPTVTADVFNDVVQVRSSSSFGRAVILPMLKEAIQATDRRMRVEDEEESRAPSGADQSPLSKDTPFCSQGVFFEPQCIPSFYPEARTFRDLWKEMVGIEVGGQLPVGEHDTNASIVGPQRRPGFENQPKVLNICSDCGALSAIALAEKAETVTLAASAEHEAFLRSLSWTKSPFVKAHPNHHFLLSPAPKMLTKYPARYFPLVALEIGGFYPFDFGAAPGTDPSSAARKGQGEAAAASQTASRGVTAEKTKYTNETRALLREAMSRVANDGLLFLSCHAPYSIEQLQVEVNAAAAAVRREVMLIKEVGPSGDFPVALDQIRVGRSNFRGWVFQVNP
jgi:hypothetical protein